MGIARPCVFLALRRSSNQPWMVDPKLVFLEMKIGRRLSLGFGLLLLIALLLRPFEITQQQSINCFAQELGHRWLAGMGTVAKSAMFLCSTCR